MTATWWQGHPKKDRGFDSCQGLIYLFIYMYFPFLSFSFFLSFFLFFVRSFFLSLFIYLFIHLFWYAHAPEKVKQHSYV